MDEEEHADDFVALDDDSYPSTGSDSENLCTEEPLVIKPIPEKHPSTVEIAGITNGDQASTHDTVDPINQPEKSTTRDDEVIFNVLRKLLRCTVCFEIQADSNQCKNGHLICRYCTTRLEQNAQTPPKATCPTCRVPLQPGLSRCLLVQQLASELPAPCSYCKLYFRQLELAHHEINLCKSRPFKCRYALFGCPWTGRWCDGAKHQEICFFPNKKVYEIEPIILEYINEKTKPVQEMKHAWREVLSILADKPRGMTMCTKEVSLRRKVCELGSSDMNFKEIWFTGSTCTLSRIGINTTSVDVGLDIDERRLHYRIKFSGNLGLKFRFQLVSFMLGDMTLDILDHLHTPKGLPNKESARFSCSLQFREQTNILSCKKLIDRFIHNAEVGSLRLDILLFYESNKCAIRIPQTEVHEWSEPHPVSNAPARATLIGSTPTATRLSMNNRDEVQGTQSHSMTTSASQSTNHLPSCITHTMQHNQFRPGRDISNWEMNSQQAGLSTVDSLLLDLSSRGYGQQEQFDLNEATSPTSAYDRIQYSMLNNEFAQMVNNNALIDDDIDDDIDRNVDLLSRVNIPITHIKTPRERKSPKIKGVKSKISQKVKNNTKARTNGRNGIKVKKTLTKQLKVKVSPIAKCGVFFTIQRMAPYMSRIHLAPNLEMITPKLKRKCIKKKNLQSHLRVIKKPIRLVSTKSRFNVSSQFHPRNLLTIKRPKFSPKALFSIPKNALILQMHEFWKLAKQRSVNMVVQTKAFFGYKPLNILSEISPGMRARWGRVVRSVGVGAMMRADDESLDLRQTSCRPDAVIALNNLDRPLNCYPQSSQCRN